MKRLGNLIAAMILFSACHAGAAENYLFQAFDSPDRYVKIPGTFEKPVLIVFVPGACRKCWNEWREFFAAFVKWEKKYDVWFVSDFPVWSMGRDMLRQSSWPAKVSNFAYHDAGRRFAKAKQMSDKQVTLVTFGSAGFRMQEVRGARDWPRALTALLGKSK